MKNKLELGLLESEAIMKKGGLSLVNNVGKVIAAITLFVAALITFTDITLADFGTQGFTTTLVMLTIASYLMYFSLEDAGEGLGEESEEYVEALGLYEKEKDKICGENIDALRDFCFEYSKEDLKYRQKNFLISHGLGLSDLEKFRAGDAYPKKLRKALIAADRMKAVMLTPKQVLTKERTATKSELSNPEKRKILRLILRLIPSTIGMSITVSVMLTAKEGLTPAVIIEGILKLSTLPIVGFKGYSNGYSFVKKRCIPWLETKRRILEAFNKSQSKESLY